MNIEIQGKYAFLNGELVASITEVKWWGCRVHSHRKGWPVFLGGLGKRRSSGRGHYDAMLNGESFGIFKSRKKAFEALVRHHVEKLGISV